MKSDGRWQALESNPETINPFLTKIGVRGVECVDVYSFDEEMLQFVPQPQLALILCFPSSEARDFLSKQYEEVEKNGTKPEGVFFMNQSDSIGNACGTFALFHSLANLEGRVDLGKGKFFKWFEKAKLVKEEERSDLLSDGTHTSDAHDETAEEGETENSDQVDYHFITYVNKNGQLYEIDSCAPFPRPLGATTDSSLVKDASVAIKKLMNNVQNLNFSAMALIGK
ncbi:unnamed protein product [Caenorhabditis sp. 36 PRJEB53466]|nr:unnamed protein product [Caenorhabditis sp. 36 PRJEB53466]